MQLRSKKDLIENFIATVNTATKVDDDWISSSPTKTDLIHLSRGAQAGRLWIALEMAAQRLPAQMLTASAAGLAAGGGNRAAKKDGIIAKLQAISLTKILPGLCNSF